MLQSIVVIIIIIIPTKTLKKIWWKIWRET